MLFLLLLSVIFASLNGILLHKAKLASTLAVYRLNLLTACVWLVCLLSLNGFRLHVDRTVLLFGLAYGAVQALFIFFKTLAMNTGPVSVTTLMGNGSLLLSILVCYLAWGERVSIGDGIGLAILLVGIALVNYRRSAGGGMRRGWLLFAVLFLLFGAGVGICFKAFSKTAASANDMMIVAAFVMSLLFFVLCLTAGRGQAMGGIDRRFLVIAVASGLCSCLYNRMNIGLSGALDAIVFFPFFNGGVVILSTICSVLFTKERLSALRIVGLLLGTVAIAIIGIL